MKNQKVKIVLIFVGIILFLLWQIILLDRMDQIQWMAQAESDRVDQSLSSDIRRLEVDSISARLDDLESKVQWEHDQRLIDLERKTERLEDILLRVDGVQIVHGQIIDMAYSDQWELEIEFEEDVESFAVSTEVKAYLVDTIGLVERPMEDLKEKFDSEKERYEKSRDRMDDYTFIVVNGEILHIYQGMSLWLDQ